MTPTVSAITYTIKLDYSIPYTEKHKELDVNPFISC